MDDIAEIKKKKLEEMTSKKRGEVVHAHSVAEFKEESNKRLVVVDFYADWCGPCRILSPTLEKLATDMGFLLAKIDTDANQEESAAFGVQSIPTVLLVRNGKIVDHFIGARDPGFIREKVSKWL